MSHIRFEPRAVCVFCASSREVDKAIFEAGSAMTRQLARAGLALVFGGTSCGLMGAVSEAHKQAGGKVIGVIPKSMVEAGIQSPILDTCLIANDMADRKTTMNRHSGAFIVLPGGLGTFDEFFDILTLKVLNQHQKPIILLNTLNYFAPLIALIKHGIAHKTIGEQHLSLFQLAETPGQAMEFLERWAPSSAPPA